MNLARIAMGPVLSLVAACVGAPEPATQVVVLVGGDARIDELEVSVLTENGRNLAATARMELPESDQGRRLPTSFVLIPADPDHPEAHRFRLVVNGRWTLAGQSVPLVRRIVVGGFTANETTLLPLVLSAECSEELCGCPWTEDACPQTCEPASIGRSVQCVPVPEYEQLAVIEPGEELGALASGVGGCGVGEVLDARRQCADLDECAFGLDDCSVTPSACVNEETGEYGWHCSCPDGFAGDGVGPDGCR